METKKYLYAAVGAPVMVAREAQTKVEQIRARILDTTNTVGKDAQKRVDGWATEGEKVIDKVTDSKKIDELTAKVDFDQAKNQVGKLRDQLEDLVATWKTNFRPETEAVTVKTTVEAKPAAKTTAAKTTAAKTTAAKATATKKPAAKKPAAKKPAAKATTAKKPAAKTAAAKKPAAKTASTKAS